MTEAGTFCPRCGDPVDADAAGVDDSDSAGAGQQTSEASAGVTRRERSLCDACYFEDFEFVDAPERIEVMVCARCGAVHRGNRWVDVDADDYTDVAIEETTEALAVHVEAEDVEWQVRPEQVDPNTIRMHSQFSGVVRGELRTEEVTVPVKVSRQTCKRCGRIAGDSFASIVQVRAVGRDPTSEETDRARELADQIVADMEDTGDRNAFVTDVSPAESGIDLKLSTNKIGLKLARKLVEEFGGSFEDHEKLVTEDEDGNEVYRVTYAVRFPEFTPGDVIDLADDDGGPVLVRSVHGNLKGVRVTTGEPYEASYEDGDAPDARKLGTRDDATDATVVTVEDDNAVQILDPETYESTTVPRPDYLDADASTVPAFKSRAGLHVLPEA
jgi:nonsense-mediated mRNA decay protein 3